LNDAGLCLLLAIICRFVRFAIWIIWDLVGPFSELFSEKLDQNGDILLLLKNTDSQAQNASTNRS